MLSIEKRHHIMKAIFFKSDSDVYRTVFEESGYEALFIEPLQFKYINLPELAKRLTATDYNGIILTSPRAIEAVSQCKSHTGLSDWIERRVYAVGEASGNRIKDLLNLNASGLESGNAENLAQIIIKENSVGSRFLFPCGNLRTETIIERLSENGMLIDPLTVYETEENENLKSNLSSLQMEEYVLMFFFSPSGVQFVYAHFQSMGADVSKYLFFAIGNSTCKKLQDLGIKVSGVASKPNPHCLVEAANNVTRS